MTFDLILRYWPFLTFLVFVVAYVLRVEQVAKLARTEAKAAAEKVEKLEQKNDALISKLFDEIRDMAKSVFRIEGKLGIGDKQ
jgi:hypothetical protein